MQHLHLKVELLQQISTEDESREGSEKKASSTKVHWSWWPRREPRRGPPRDELPRDPPHELADHGPFLPGTGNEPQIGAGASPYHTANLLGLVLGCIEADFLRVTKD